jgi:hypothetical protein
VDKVVGLGIDHKITGEDISRIVQVIDTRLERHPKLRVYAKVEPISGLSAGAPLKYIGLALRHSRRSEREAIVSDAAWLGKLATIGERKFPGIGMRHFTTSENDRTLQWIIEQS